MTDLIDVLMADTVGWRLVRRPFDRTGDPDHRNG